MIGKTISHYKILEKLGEGGMGVVYKAQDTKLDRIVALKFLPKHLLCDDEAKTRFEHEAKAASALNHTNITTIYEIDEFEGECFICMEYVEGKSIKELIKEKTLYIQDILNISIQIAEGLNAAHKKGIIHRDIKADNIMLTADGLVKIMDFGLAKLKGASKVTKTGSTLGTLQYMSPEQVQGLEVDQGSDIFSFGVVLYEMVTGQLPFKGEHEAAIIYSILNEAPEPLARYKANVPEGLQRIVDKALAKQKEERYQHVDELVVDLRTLRGGIRPARSDRRKVKPVYALIAIVMIAIIVGVVFMSRHHFPRVNPNLAFSVVQTSFTDIQYPGLSSDGNWIAFPRIKNASIYFMNVSGGEPRLVTSDSLPPSMPWQVDISPDGSQIAYDRFNPETDQFEVCIVSSLGGLSKKIAQPGFGSRWRPDGQRIGYLRGSRQFPSNSGKLELWSVRPDGSDSRLEFMDSTGLERGAVSFSWSPDGKSIAWIRGFSGGYDEVIIHKLEIGKERQLTFNKKNVQDVYWIHNDQIVFSSDRGGNMNLWAIPAVGGEAVQITKGIGPDLGPKASTDGQKLIYLLEQHTENIWISESDGSNARQITFDDRILSDPSFSPDGKFIAFTMGDINPLKSEGRHVYIMDRDGNNRRQQTYGLEMARSPAWSPDGKWIAYSSKLSSVDSSKICLTEVSKPGNSRPISSGMRAWWVSPETLITHGPTNSLITSINGAAPERFFQDSTWAFLILNGKYILYYDLHKGREGWWIVSSTAPLGSLSGKPKKICSTPWAVVLSPNQKFMLCVNPGPEFSKLDMLKISLPDGKEEPYRPWKPSNIGLENTNGVSSRVALSYDGREMVYMSGATVNKLVVINHLFR